MRQLRIFSLTLTAVLVLYACAVVGGLVPKTFNEKLQDGYTAVTAIASTTRTLLNAGKIDPDDAQNVHDVAEDLKNGLDVAVEIKATDPGQAGDRLNATITGLTALQAYLLTRSKTQ